MDLLFEKGKTDLDEGRWSNGKWFFCIICKKTTARNYRRLPCFHLVCNSRNCLVELNKVALVNVEGKRMCPICEIVYGGTTELVSAKEEWFIYQNMKLIHMKDCCQTDAERNIACKTCHIRYCQNCYMSHEDVPLLRKSHIIGEFKKLYFQCLSCNHVKATIILKDNDYCKACVANSVFQELTEFPVSLENEVKKDIQSLRKSCMKLTSRRCKLERKLASLNSKSAEHLPLLNENDRLTSQSLTACKMNQVKAELEKITNFGNKLYEMVARFIAFLMDYMDTNIFALNESYSDTYRVIVERILEEISAVLNEKPKPCSPAKNLVFECPSLSNIREQESNVNRQFENVPQPENGEDTLPVNLSTCSLSSSYANMNKEPSVNANFNKRSDGDAANSSEVSCFASATPRKQKNIKESDAMKENVSCVPQAMSPVQFASLERNYRCFHCSERFVDFCVMKKHQRAHGAKGPWSGKDIQD